MLNLKGNCWITQLLKVLPRIFLKAFVEGTNQVAKFQVSRSFGCVLQEVVKFNSIIPGPRKFISNVFIMKDEETQFKLKISQLKFFFSS